MINSSISGDILRLVSTDQSKALENMNVTNIRRTLSNGIRTETGTNILWVFVMMAALQEFYNHD
jgi:hypothetical protein